MTFVFNVNVDNIFSTRITAITVTFITCYHTAMTLLIFEN